MNSKKSEVLQASLAGFMANADADTNEGMSATLLPFGSRTMESKGPCLRR